MQTRVQTGTLVSGLGHAGLILWVILGDWLFAPAPADEVIVTQVSMMTSAEFDALQAAASTPTPSEEPAPTPKPQPRPDPVVEPEPAPEPTPEPTPEPPPEPEPEPVPVPDDLPTAAEEQLLPSPSLEEQAVPDAAEIVAPVPVEVPEEVETSDTPTPAVSDQPTEEPVVPQEQTEETVAEDTGTVLETEATQDQDEPLGMTASVRPRARPERPPEEPAPEDLAEQVAAVVDAPETPVEEPAEEPATEAPTEDAVADALAEALAEDTSEPTSDTGGSDLPQGPPLTAGEVGDVRSAIGNKWNLGSASTDALRTTIVVRVSFSPDGQPTSVDLLESDGPTEAATSTAFSAARRAVLRAHQDGGIPLPADKYDTWRVLDLVFDPNGMRLR